MKKVYITLVLLCVLSLAFKSFTKVADPSSETTSFMTAKMGSIIKVSTGPVIATMYESENNIQISGQFGSNEGISLMTHEIRLGEFNVTTDALITTYLNNSTKQNNS